MFLNIYSSINKLVIISVICLSSFVSNAKLPNKVMQSKINEINRDITSNIDNAVHPKSHGKSNLRPHKRQLNPIESSQLSKPSRVINVKKKDRLAVISDVDQKASADFVSSVDNKRNKLDAEEKLLTGN